MRNVVVKLSRHRFYHLKRGDPAVIVPIGLVGVYRHILLLLLARAVIVVRGGSIDAITLSDRSVDRREQGIKASRYPVRLDVSDGSQKCQWVSVDMGDVTFC